MGVQSLKGLTLGARNVKRSVQAATGIAATPPDLTSGRAILYGGAGSDTTIQYFEIQTLGNSVNFGNKASGRYGHTAVGSSTRSICCGGYSGDASNYMDYVTVATTGNATFFGNMSLTRYIPGGVSNNVRGLIYAGDTSGNSSATANIEYVTIATAGNGTSFGSLTSARFSMGNGGGSDTRALMPGGWNSSYTLSLTEIEYVTIATTSNSVNFGNLTVAGRAIGTVSSPTRAVFGNRVNHTTGVSTMDYITIATTGNATNFGTSLYSTGSLGASTHVRGVYVSGAEGKNLHYITIATLGNSVTFGTVSGNSVGSTTSNAHGGIPA